MDKKKLQLGMNPSTASGKLLKDLLFDFISKEGYVCYRCKLPMSREDFSIEHIIPWLDSEDPIGLFFDINNISYSHLTCNVLASKRLGIKKTSKGIKHGISAYRKLACRCEVCKLEYNLVRKDKYSRLKT